MNGVGTFLACAGLAAGTVYLIVESEKAFPPAPVNGTITAVNHYPGHERAGVTATSTSLTTDVVDPATQLVSHPAYVSTGVVQWNPTTEVCFRFDDGTAGCRYVTIVEPGQFRVGDRLDVEPLAGMFCAPHSAPTDEAADEDCPAFAADGDRVIPQAVAA